MKVIVVGLGVQGRKRRHFAGNDFVASVDPVNKDAQYQSVEDVPVDSYDAALLCVPDDAKLELLEYLLSRGKHVLVEKPLWAPSDKDILHLQDIARRNKAICQTAYNHRFEPHYVRMRDLISSGDLGALYRCRMFYGNGTARLVRNSPWRDQGAGVLSDLGSHLLDTARFWFDDLSQDFKMISANCFENQAPDHVVFGSETTRPTIELEMTLLNWRNHFTCDIFGENGSAHITSLCKWGPSSFITRRRVLPSGRPPEEVITLTQEDPTWELEYENFKTLCAPGQETDLSNDLWLNRLMQRLSEQALTKLGQ